MTARLDQRFAALKRDGRSALVAYVMATLVAGMSPQLAFAQNVLPDSVNLPVAVGSTLHDPCDIANWPTNEPRPAFAPPAAQCVLVPAGHTLELQNAYVRALRNSGWDFEGGAGNAFYFERPTERPDCRQALDLIGFPRDLNDDAAGVVFIFALRPDPICRTSS